ncbi:TadE family protein [Arthrobacter woluwensis]|uniref:TadE family protein n=1 Tax=Arthrobacter woluwensis TaxID=156980 RepID=UPI00380ADD46
MKHWMKGNREKGSESMESVITTALMLFFVLAIVQYSLYAHAQGLAHQAAIAAVGGARRDDGSEAAGNATGRQLLEQNGSVFRGVTLNTTRTATEARVTVTGKVVSFVPWELDGLDLHEEVTAPVERWMQR